MVNSLAPCGATLRSCVSGVGIITSLLVIMSCSSGSSDRISYQLVRPDLHLGEYLQVLNDNTIVTFSRDAEPKGLARITIETGEISILDADASEGRDLKMSEGLFAYRIGTDIYFLNSARFLIVSEVTHLQSFQWHGDFGRITYRTKDGSSLWKTFDAHGKSITSGRLGGAVKDSIKTEMAEWLFCQTIKGLVLLIMESRDHGASRQITLTDDAYSGLYVDAKIIGDTLWIAHMHEIQGTFWVSQLKVASLKDDKPAVETELVDGEADKSYRGLDITIAAVEGRPIFYYLDGWSLRLRQAHKEASGWKTRELSLNGALGFYTQIISENAEQIVAATHNFRINLDGVRQSFEDLLVFRLEPPRR